MPCFSSVCTISRSCWQGHQNLNLDFERTSLTSLMAVSSSILRCKSSNMPVWATPDPLSAIFEVRKKIVVAFGEKAKVGGGRRLPTYGDRLPTGKRSRKQHFSGYGIIQLNLLNLLSLYTTKHLKQCRSHSIALSAILSSKPQQPQRGAEFMMKSIKKQDIRVSRNQCNTSDTVTTGPKHVVFGLCGRGDKNKYNLEGLA